MREAVRDQLLAVIGRRQLLTESAIADELGSLAPPAEVLRVQLQHLEREGLIRRNNNRQFSMAVQSLQPAAEAPAVESQEPGMARSNKETKTCPRCGDTKLIGEFRSNGYCKPCGKKYDADRLAKKERQTASGGGAKPQRAKQRRPSAAPTPTSPASRVQRLIVISINDRHGKNYELELTHDQAAELVQAITDTNSQRNL